MRLITASGYRPTDAELAAAGLSREAADALAEQFLRANKLLPEQQHPVYVVTGGTKKSTGTGRSSRSGSGSSGSSPGSSRRGGGANDRDVRLN